VKEVNEKIKFRSIAQIRDITNLYLNDKSTSENVAMEIWLAAWEGIGCPRGQEEVQVSKRFIRNVCLNKIRKSLTEDRILRAKANEHRHEPKWEEIELKVGQLMNRAKLTAQQSEVLSRFFFLNQSMAVIANRFATNIANVSKILEEALAEIKRVARLEDR
jgi:DNA-directed RNA polymerase specialized sigma24 family protein